MRIIAAFAAFVLLGCGGSGNGSSGGPASQCSQTATQLCEKAAACSTGNDGGVTVFIISADADSGLHSYGFTINGDESHCENFMKLICEGQHAADFTAACGPAISGLQCGTDSTFGNGVVVPSPCGQNL